MAVYTLFHPDHEYLGQVLIDFEKAAGSNRVQYFFELHGLDDLDPQAWYSAQKFIDVLNDLEESGEVNMLDFVSIGLKQAEAALLPDDLPEGSVVDALKAMDTAYQLNSRGTDIGEITCEIISDTHVKILFRVPQPDDVWYGICYGYMQRLAPKGTDFSVYYDETVPRRLEGGEHTVIHIEW